jgi:hypothetical protein
MQLNCSGHSPRRISAILVIVPPDKQIAEDPLRLGGLDHILEPYRLPRVVSIAVACVAHRDTWNGS